jgi:hypothetical protein
MGRCALTTFTATERGEIVLVPEPAAAIKGRVRWPDAAAGARVVAQGEGYAVAADCAPDGSFTLDGLPPDLPVELVATARIGAATWVARAVARPGSEVVLEAEPQGAPK